MSEIHNRWLTRPARILACCERGYYRSESKAKHLYHCPDFWGLRSCVDLIPYSLLYTLCLIKLLLTSYYSPYYTLYCSTPPYYSDHTTPILENLIWRKIEVIVKYNDQIKVSKPLNVPITPKAVRFLFVPLSIMYQRVTRATPIDALQPPSFRLSMARRSFSYRALPSWNSNLRDWLSLSGPALSQLSTPVSYHLLLA